MNNFKIGDRVKHKPSCGSGYGAGTIKSLKPYHNAEKTSFIAEVLFDVVPSDKKQLRSILVEFLISEQAAEKKVEEKNEHFQIGDHVSHSRFGNGIVQSLIAAQVAEVSFDSGKKIAVGFNELIRIKAEIITDVESKNEEEEVGLRVIPSNYADQSCYSANAKRLLSYLKTQYPEGGFVSLKSYSENDGEIGVLVVPSKGIIVFKLIETSLSADMVCSPLFEQMANAQHYNALKSYYIDKFLQSKSLCHFIDDKNKILKFPVRFVLLYQNVQIDRKADLEKIRLTHKNKDIFFRYFSSPFEGNDLFSHFEKYESPFTGISKDYYASIIERIIPENATLVQVKPASEKKTIVSTNPEFYPITGTEREFSALCLDDTQIKAINDTKPGHYLTLANPGTGKSVLLVSKAYRIQSIKKNNHVLITCYNKNLAEHHSIFAEISGLKTQNLHISTFHRLALELVGKVDPGFIRNHPFNEEEDNYDSVIDRLEELVKQGKVQTLLNAIFIDEIQLFEPRWIDICLALLDKENGKPYYFEMFGDINQDVKSQRSKGTASWQKAKTLPSLAGRVKKLEQNYRNTDLIANYLKCMISEFNQTLNTHGLPIDPDSVGLSSITTRKGFLKTKVLLSPNTNVGKVIDVIKELIQKRNAEYNEIAVIYPAKGYGRFYKPLWHIRQGLESNDIPYSLIHGEEKQKLFECDGVILSTVDSCLGLDFKYVILCGIHYWDLYYNEKTGDTQKWGLKELNFKPEIQYYYSEIGKKIYSACSRARDGLFIVDDTDPESLIKAILRPKEGRNYYDER